MNTEKWNPELLFETSGSYWMSCTLHTAVSLDIFTTIGGGQLTAGKIAQRLSADTRGITMLLNALAAMDLLEKHDELYANKKAGVDFLSKDSSRYLGHMIMHHHHLVNSWSRLDEAVRSGEPVRSRSSFEDEEVRESFLMGMFNIAMNAAPLLVEAIDLSGRHRLLDLGGGPGTYAIHFCLKYPRLTATVFDLPATRPFAEKTIDRFDLTDRINFMDGDFVEEEIAGRYDAAWLSHILHAEGPDVCRRILQKTVEALEPGGTIIIHEFILNDTMDGPLFPAVFSLNMLLGTQTGRSYSEEQLREMLASAGLRDIRRIPVESPNDSGIITGIRG